MGEQLFLFGEVRRVLVGDRSMLCCDVCACYFVDGLCPLCFPRQETVFCGGCRTEFEDSSYMIQSMCLSETGKVRCELCLPRQTLDDCRDQNELHRASEEARHDQLWRREHAKTLSLRLAESREVRDE